MKKRLILGFVALAMMFLAVTEAEALTWNPFKRTGRVKASTLLVTGNFIYSRLLTELAQYYSKQPIITISPDVDGGHQLFFMPATNNASAIAADEFMDVVEYINPKRVVVLGGGDYVPREFVDLARAKYSVILLDSDDWNKNAESLAEILKLKKLPALFKDARTNIDEVTK